MYFCTIFYLVLESCFFVVMNDFTNIFSRPLGYSKDPLRSLLYYLKRVFWEVAVQGPFTEFWILICVLFTTATDLLVTIPS